MSDTPAVEWWLCPACGHRNKIESMTCRRPLEGKREPARVVPRICGYDRRHPVLARKAVRRG